MKSSGRMRPLLCLVLLAGEYLLIRGPLFAWHGMIQWPLILALPAAGGIVLGLIPGVKDMDLWAVVGYGLGFGAGLVFHQPGMDPGGSRTDNLWLIWTAVLLVFLAVPLLRQALQNTRK